MTDQQLALAIVGLLIAASIFATVAGLAWRKPTVLQGLVDSIDYASDVMGRSVAWCTLLLVLVQFIVIWARASTSISWLVIPGLTDYVNYHLILFQDLAAWAYAFIFLLGASYTLRHDEHVRVDVFYGRLSAKGKAWVNAIGVLIFLLPVCGALLWFLWDDLLTSWRQNETSQQEGGMPAFYVVKTAVVLMNVQLLVQGFAMFCASLLVIAGQRHFEEPHHDEGL